jgi:flagellar export protein FliJ
MNDELKSSRKRLERLLQIRQAYVSVAENAVKQSEREVRQLEGAEIEVVRNIQHTQAGIAYLETTTGYDLQARETYIRALQAQRKLIQQSLDKANSKLEQRRREWTEAMRDKRIIEKTQERRLHQWEREENVANQKTQDDAPIGRYIRSRQNH